MPQTSIDRDIAIVQYRCDGCPVGGCELTEHVRRAIIVPTPKHCPRFPSRIPLWKIIGSG